MAEHKIKPSIPRNSLIWLLIAQVLVILPLLWHVPLWIIGLWLVCAAWRIQVFRMRMQFPKAIVKVAMMVSAAFAVYLSRGSLVGLDAGVALLLTAFVLKLVELRSKRDALVLIYLGFFTVVTSYLFDDSILAAGYSLLSVTALLAALVGLQQTVLTGRPGKTVTQAAAILLQAIPVALLLFLFFPRLDPLWVLPTPKDKGVTGISDHMSPGDIAELSQSSELVFRASFTGEIPTQNQLYWRALTLPYFDGRTWHMQNMTSDLLAPEWQAQGDMLEYSVIMQPSSRTWLYSLAVSQTDQKDIRLMNDFRLQHNTPIHRTYLYQARAWPEALAEPKLSPEKYRFYLQLPHKVNPQARAWAQQLRQRYPDDESLVRAVLRTFNQEEYFYTLKPPRLGKHSVDEFLFATQTGFCEHYSSAMTFVLRAAGIPARVVTGYQGGEVNRAENYVQVRQYDAHSWVEYWRLGFGWHRVDPTFQVAPERIEQGLQEALRGESLNTGLFSPLSYRHINWINQLRISWDTLNYTWQKNVLGYQAERQKNWLKGLLGEISWQRIGVGLVITIALLFALISLWLFKPWQTRLSETQRLLKQFERLLAKRQYKREPAEGLRAFQARIQADLSPPQRMALDAFVHSYEQNEYANVPVPAVQLKQQLQTLRHSLAGR